MADENTAIGTGAEPVVETHGDDSSLSTDKGAQGTGSQPEEDEKLIPFGEDPRWKSARQAEKTLQKLMADNEVDDPDDLLDLVQSGKKVVGKVDPDELDTLIEKASTLARYQEFWDRQKEEELLANEEPNETAERLKQENAALKAEKAQQKAIAANQAALKEYDTIVLSGIKDALPELPDTQRHFLSEFLGVGNPAVEVDITNKSAVSKVVKDGVKKFEKFKQQIIKDYLAGKEKIPDVQKLESGGVPATGEVKTLKDARKAFLGMFK
jgi:hypothetical protein